MEEARIAGRYRIGTQLGRGGMGVVYRAFDESLGRDVALKRLRHRGSADSHELKLFQREYYTLSQLQHPRIIEVYDYGIDDEGAFYTMELLDGKDVRELAPLEYRQACRHLRDVASSLALLHARRLLYRDLSARNVRLTGEGRAKLLDFGALTTFGVPAQVVGTPPAVPPEAIYAQPLDQRSDLYAFGALAYWLLTASHAYPTSKLSALPMLWQQHKPLPPSALSRGVPPELDALVMSLLSLEPLTRPSSAAEVIERLNVIGGLDSEELGDVGESYLVNPRLVRRGHELERLRRLTQRLRESKSGSLLVEGEPGIGKTRLVQELTLEAQLEGVTVLWADAELFTGPYGVVRALAGSLRAAVPELAAETAEPFRTQLSSLLPVLFRAAPGGVSPDKSADRLEVRVRLQTALGAWLLSVSRRRPLLLVIDNAHAADDGSLALCAALPRIAEDASLGVVAVQTRGEPVAAPRGLDALRANSAVVTLTGLEADATIELVTALFGDVDNAGRLGRWLHDRTAGNPLQCLTLAAQLISDGLVTYKDGAWVLPAEPSVAELPSGMGQVLAKRLARLSDPVRSFAEALSVERGSLSLEHCLALGNAEAEQVFAWLVELIREGILVSDGDSYRFSQLALRNYLYDGLSSTRRSELHRRAGEYLLDRAGSDSLMKITAGWHLLRGGEESRGADILVKVGHQLVWTVEGLAHAAPGLEAALGVYERERRSEWTLLNVLDALTSAGWYVDRAYAERYAERTLTLALKLSGLSLAKRLAPVVGPKVAVTAGTAAAAALHRGMRRRIDVRRFKKFKGVYGPVVNALAILVGVAANSFDPRAARSYLDAAEMMKFFGDPTIRVMYDYARYYTCAAEGRLAEAEPIGKYVVAWFGSPAAIKRLGEPAARALSGGQMTGLGMFGALGGAADSLEWATKLESLGLSLYAVMGTQTRFVYHLFRGEASKAKPYRQRLELNAIQGGTTWQTSILIPLLLGSAGVVSGDVVALRKAAAELEQRAQELPVLEPIVEMLRGAHQLTRGCPEEALPPLMRAKEAMPPRGHTFWAVSAALCVRALLACGRNDEALELSRRTVCHLVRGDENFGLVFLELITVHALALAHGGEIAAAERRLEELIARHAPREVPMVLALLHEARARVALLASDWPRFEEHLAQMGAHVRATENPSLIAKWNRLDQEARRRLDGVPGSVDTAAEDATFSLTSAVRSILESHRGLERAKVALELVVEHCSAPEGYLYLGTPSRLELVARVPEDREPPPEVLLSIATLGLQAADHTVMTATVRADAVLDTASRMATSGEAFQTVVVGGFTVLLLSTLDAEGPTFVGALVLKCDDRTTLPAHELIAVLARSLLRVRLEETLAADEAESNGAVP